MTCPTCQPERGWWHKIFQQCKICKGWPKPLNERMAQHKTGDSFYNDPNRDMTIAEFSLLAQADLVRFVRQTERDMERVGKVTYTFAEWDQAYKEWRERNA
jgi:hypothetical protein